jgi:hypothetical protein
MARAERIKSAKEFVIEDLPAELQNPLEHNATLNLACPDPLISHPLISHPLISHPLISYPPISCPTPPWFQEAGVAAI